MSPVALRTRVGLRGGLVSRGYFVGVVTAGLVRVTRHHVYRVQRMTQQILILLHVARSGVD